MSFTVELKKELAELNIKSGCCKKSLAWGILLDADHEEGTDEVAVSFPDLDVAEAVGKLFAGVFGKHPEIIEKTVIGHKRYVVKQSSKAAATTLERWDSGTEKLGLSPDCGSCGIIFVRGAIIGCAMINDPQKETHLEFRFKHTSRAALLYPFLSEFGDPPKIVNRKSSCGLYFKKSGLIEDLLLQCGAQQAGFKLINDKIKNEIRNTENRLTNCEARNIEKAVTASHRHVTAIRYLMSQPSLWESLSEDLRDTARLRMQNEGASLQELMLMHNPPISKSGLNHRLERLLKLAQAAQEQSKV